MSPRRSLQVVVLIDGLGWRILEGRDFLDDLLPHRRPLRTVLGYSSGAIPTILTGAPPALHGHWNLVYHDPESSPFRWLEHLRFLPDGVLEHRVTRKLLKELGRRALGLGGLFECCVSPRLLPRFNWVEKTNIYERGGIAGAPSIFDRLADAEVPYRVYSYHRWRDAEILQRAPRDIIAGDADFFFVYLSELDAYLHAHVDRTDLVGDRLDWYAAGLRELFTAARRRNPEASLIVTSDHGMTPVRRHYDLVGDVERLGFAMPADYLAVYDSTMARFWLGSERARRAIADCLRAVPCGRLVSEDELRELGVFFPDGRYGELVFLLDPGWLFSRSGFNGPGWSPAGMHGYHPDDPHSDAVFLSDREPQAEVRTIADVYRCMEDIGAWAAAG